jgi:UDP-N-acetylmuramate dehydrogenase
MDFLSGLEHFVRRDEPLGRYTWLRIGGPAEYFAEPTSVDELAALLRRAAENDLPVRLLGGGSNLLVREQGVPGVVVLLAAATFGQIKVSGDTITAGGGAKLGHVVSTAVREGLAGLEPLVGIPGTVGGALHGNAGSHGDDIGQWTEKATVIGHSGEIAERSRSEMSFGYRESSLDELVILSATFRLGRDDPEQLTKRMQKQWIVKKANHPLGHQSTACLFKSPGGMSAGMLIDQAGLKGTRVGGAEISDRHANFVVADADAKSRDILELMEQVSEKVLERTGIELVAAIEVW